MSTSVPNTYGQQSNLNNLQGNYFVNGGSSWGNPQPLNSSPIITTTSGTGFPVQQPPLKEASKMETHNVGNGRSKTFTFPTTLSFPLVRAFERHVDGTKDDHEEWFTEVVVDVEYTVDSITVEFDVPPARNGAVVVVG